MSSKSQKALKIAAVVILAIVAVVFVVLYLTGKVDDFLGVTSDTESSSITEDLTQDEQPAVNSPESISSTSSTSQSTPESTSSAPSTPQSTPESISSTSSTSQSMPESTPTVQTVYKFRNKNLLDQHYEKHGRDMGFASAEEYEKAASAVVNNPDALHKIEKEDGDDVYYVESTNEFVVVSTDGYIRTYFLPDRGIDYFNKQ